MVMLPLYFGEWYTWFVFRFSVPFIRCGAIVMDVSYALIAAVGLGIGISFEMHFGVFEQLEVMRLTFGKVSAHDFLCPLIDHYLAFGGMALLPRVEAPLSFFGRSTGDSLTSTKATSMTVSDLSSAFLPGKWNCPSAMSASST